MDRARLLKHFDTLAATPDAVAKLRELVLGLAASGMLIPGIETAKWTDCTLDDIGEWGSGGTPRKGVPGYYGGNIPWLVIGDLNDGIVTSAATSITEEGLANSSAKVLDEDVLLIAMYGSIGKLGITGIRCATNQAIAFCKPDRAKVELAFLFHLLRSLRSQLLDRGQGLAQQNISQRILRAFPIKLPPLAEQQRIVARVEELLALCDELEARQMAAREQRTRLVQSAFDHLTAARDDSEFRKHSAFCLQHSDLLFDSIPALRQAILSLAVQGRLIPQDTSDEPASKLITSLRAARALQTTRSRANDPDSISVDASFNVAHGPPPGWVTVKLGEIADIGSGSTPTSTNPAYYEGGTIPWVTSAATAWPEIDSAETFVTPKAVEDFRLRTFPPTTIIIALYGQGKTRGQVSRLRIAATVNQACSAITLPPGFEAVGDYLMLVFRQQYLRLREQAAGGAQPNLNGAKIKSIVLPLPPLAEQQRIVAKVAALMSWCDELEARLAAAQSAAAALLDSSLHALLAD